MRKFNFGNRAAGWATVMALLLVPATLLPGLTRAEREISGPVTPAQAPASASAKEPAEDKSALFSGDSARLVLDQLSQALAGNDEHHFLSLFDRKTMPGYGAFRDQLRSFLNRYDQFQLHYHITQVAMEGGRGIVLADFAMEGSPRGPSALPLRRSGWLRLELQPKGKHWKIVGLQPFSFFF